MKHSAFLSLCICIAISLPALAQKSGQSATITIGVVKQAERITLQSTGGGKGALVGGALGVASGSSSKKRTRNAIIGAGAGAALASSGPSEGMQYTVQVADGSAIIVVSDQTQIQVGDCVTVEQSGDRANIRRQDPAACQPSSKEAIAAVEDELIENAEECAAAKQELLAAESTEELELASAKAKILCN